MDNEYSIHTHNKKKNATIINHTTGDLIYMFLSSLKNRIKNNNIFEREARINNKKKGE
jgi:hypothetical protein